MRNLTTVEGKYQTAACEQRAKMVEVLAVHIPLLELPDVEVDMSVTISRRFLWRVLESIQRDQ